MSGRTRILFVIENSAYGGGERTFAQLLRGLPKDRFELFCASRPEGRFYDETKEHCTFLPLDLSCRSNIFNVGKLRDMMLAHKIDMAHSQGARADFYCGLAASRAGVTAVTTVAMPVEGFNVCPLKKTVYGWLYSLAAGKFAAAITVSEHLKTELSPKFRRIEVIPNGVDLAEFSPSNFNAAPVIDKYGLRGKLVIGALGRLEWQKGYGHLIAALDIALKREPALKDRLVCLIAGGGSLAGKLKEQSSALGLEGNIRFCGEVSAARDLLGAVDIFVMPSLAEGQPLALLEAMAMAKPVVASDIPAMSRTAAAGHEALLVPPGDSQRLAAAILKLSSDIPAALALGRNARLKAERYGLDNFISGHVAFYSGLNLPVKG